MAIESAKIKFDKKLKLKLKKELKIENDYIIDLLAMFDVPDSIDDEEMDSMYLLNSNNVSEKSGQAVIKKTERAQSSTELQERLESIRNKMNSKKSKPSERAIKKKEKKKFKKDKVLKKKLISINKSLKNEKVKEEKFLEETKENIKLVKSPLKPIFNEEGKIVFSKIDFAPHPGAKTKKSKNEKYLKNPKQILQNIKEEKKKLTELVEKGEEEKALELKQEIAWKKAFDKTEGKKVKDDTSLLHRAVKKKKLQKKKSKTEWIERKKKVEQDIANRQKKRQENINKKIKEKKTKKLKRLAKKGRVIPGF